MADHPGMDLAHLKGHIKKPLNAFMLYMKDMRSKVVSECTLKESAAINQILGKRVIACKLYIFIVGLIKVPVRQNSKIPFHLFAYVPQS